MGKSSSKKLLSSRIAQLKQLNDELQIEIEQRKLVEKKLSSFYSQTRRIFDAMNDIVLIINILNSQIAGVEIIPSQYFENQTDLVLLTVEHFYEQSGQNTSLTLVHQVLQMQQSLNYDYSVCRDSEQFWFNANISPISEQAVIWVARDISRRKMAEIALLESRHLLQAIARSHPNILYVYDLSEQCIIYCNQQTLAILGYTSEEVLQMKKVYLTTLIHPEDLSKFVEKQKLLDRIIDGEIIEFQYRIRHQNGEWKWISGRETVFKRNQAAKPKQILGAVSDITARKQAEQELENIKYQLALQEKMASLGTLIGGVAHEINNPTSFIYGNIQPANDYANCLLELIGLYQQYYPTPASEIIAKENSIDLDFIVEDFPKLLSSIQEGATRISSIVSSLRNFSRLDQAKRRKADIHQLIDNTLLILQHRLKANSHNPGIEVIKNYGQIPLINCYPSRLDQVFMNLLCNAIEVLLEKQTEGQIEEYIEQGDLQTLSKSALKKTSRICILTFVRQSTVIISIADNGNGIEPQIISRIFDPFFTTKPPGKGTGLGLSISYKIITDIHGGNITCRSEVGQGTEFIVELPIK